MGNRGLNGWAKPQRRTRSMKLSFEASEGVQVVGTGYGFDSDHGQPGEHMYFFTNLASAISLPLACYGGTYKLRGSFGRYNSAAIVSWYLDGVALGVDSDLYQAVAGGSAQAVNYVDTVAIPPGDPGIVRDLRLVVTSKNGASSGYGVLFTRAILEPTALILP